MNKEEKKEYDRKRYSENSDKRKNQVKKYQSKNKNKIKDYLKEYALTNKEKLKEYQKQYQQAHRDKAKEKEYHKAYKKTPTGKEVDLRSQRKRRALKANKLHPNHDTTIEKALELQRQKLEIQTRQSYHLDHIWPLSQGGFHHHENLQVIPSSINLIKGDSMEYRHPAIKHWTDLPEWLILETQERQSL